MTSGEDYLGPCCCCWGCLGAACFFSTGRAPGAMSCPGALMRFYSQEDASVQHARNMEREAHLVNVRQNSSSGDGGADEGVELLVSSDGELQMTGSDTLDSKILGSVT